jgi:KUP system potassium uptake protein
VRTRSFDWPEREAKAARWRAIFQFARRLEFANEPIPPEPDSRGPRRRAGPIIGAEALVAARSRGAESLEGFLAGLDGDEPARVPGLAVYLATNDRLVPAALVNNLEHNRVLHERVVLMRVMRIDFPHATDNEKYSVVAPAHGFCVAEVRYGFMDQPDIPRALAQLRIPNLRFDLGATSFFIGRNKIALARGGGLWAWRKRLFIFMHLVMVSATDYYRIPSRRVVELGEETLI